MANKMCWQEQYNRKDYRQVSYRFTALRNSSGVYDDTIAYRNNSFKCLLENAIKLYIWKGEKMGENVTHESCISFLVILQLFELNCPHISAFLEMNNA